MSKSFRLGLFIIVTLAIFGFGVFWIGSKQFLFQSTYRLQAEFQNVAGLMDGAVVRVGGIHEGTVKRIDLPPRPDQKVRVVMDLRSNTRAVVKKDSMAAIKSEGLVGDKYVEISFGSNDSPTVNNGDIVQSEPPLDVADLVKKANQLLDSAGGAMEEMGAAVSNLKAISSKINRGSGSVGALVNDRTLYNNVTAGVTAFQEDMEALKHNFLLRGFFKKRGYESEADLTKDAIEKLPTASPAKRFTYDAEKLFDKPDTAKLKKAKALNAAGRYLETAPFGLAVVAVSSDMKGDADKDRALTQARAMVIRDYLVENFKLDDAKVKTIGLGKSPDVDEGSRVDLIVYGPAVTPSRSVGQANRPAGPKSNQHD
ncbi:MAG: MCE family protein [Bryobacterales bacterium]|nr:MCE family protein [Bryobacterales bacterium]